jgi:uncharacterized membrane protein
MKRNHWILMLLCCLIPLAGIAAIVVFRIPATNVLYFGLVLMCPLLHLVMMKSMRHDHTNPSTNILHQPEAACHAEPEKAAGTVGAGAPRGGTVGGAR